MTAATSLGPHVEFQQLLPTHARRSLNMTQAVVALVHAAVTNHGWTPKLLAAECGRDLHDVINAGAVITDRLRKAATHPPVGPRAAGLGPTRPFCSPECRENAGWVLSPETGLPLVRCECRSAS